jgi:hypothetical protein
MPALPRLLFCALVLCATHAVLGDEVQDRRAQAGVRLFRSLLAADLDLPKKTTGDHLLIVFYYVDDKQRAAELARLFSDAAEKIRGLDVVAEITNDATFSAYASRVPAAIFLAQSPPRATLQSIIQYGIHNRLIVYSPFEGHVELGVLAGLSVEAQVRPFVNQSTLEASRITLKEFFLKVTKVYR